ncbi:iron-containing alcohol dehydrogenase [Romeriopsis navalis]|nr:iron-containing alcohol dehydrogenase [Romeriopsis navalis]
MKPFNFANIPPLYFGQGQRSVLPDLIAQFKGQNVLLVIGGRSLQTGGWLNLIDQQLNTAGITTAIVNCTSEPSPAFIDQTCRTYRDQAIDVVIGIGGGSVVDAGKAISAMLPHKNSIVDHLEGVGAGIPHSGQKIPYIAMPTTSGTGSEVTQNAVISEVGNNGYKKSIRHPKLVPDAIIVDSELLVRCPAAITAACGMDALTQLIEAYLSPTASPLSDAIAWSGIESITPNLLLACGPGQANLDVRAGMAYGSLMSGIALVNAGLGVVHGFASPLGGLFPIPHGVVCGTLMGAAMQTTWQAMQTREPRNPGIVKMQRLGQLLRQQQALTDVPDSTIPEEDGQYFCAVLTHWTTQLEIPRLSTYGVTRGDSDRILAQTKNRNNPIQLQRSELQTILETRL